MSEHSTFTVLLYAITVLSLVFSVGWVMILSLQDRLKAPGECFFMMNVFLLIACLLIPLNYLPGVTLPPLAVFVRGLSDILIISSLVLARAGKQFLFSGGGAKVSTLEHFFTGGIAAIFYTATVILDLPTVRSFDLLFSVSIAIICARAIKDVFEYAECSLSQKIIQVIPFFSLLVLMIIRLIYLNSDTAVSVNLGANNLVMWGFFITLALANISFIAHVVETQIAFIKNISLIDSLTNVPGRRAIEAKIEEALARLERIGEDFCVMMIDIDYFKSINDEHGHAGGDAALKFASNLLSSKIRRTDTFARWGGEEFLVLLPNTNLATGAIIAEKLRKSLMCTALEWKDTSILMTASLGVAQSSLGMLGSSDIVAKADEAMFRAKSAGRNCVNSNSVATKISRSSGKKESSEPEASTNSAGLTTIKC